MSRPPLDDTDLVTYDGQMPPDVELFADDINAAYVGVTLALASIGFSIYQLANTPDKPDTPRVSESFGFDLSNAFDPNNPIPIIYGTHKVSGQYFFQQMSNLKTNNLLSMGVGIGEGPIFSVTDIKVNNIPISDIQSGDQIGEVEVFLGDVAMPSSGTGGVADIFYEPGLTQEFNDGIPTGDGTITRTTLGTNVTRIDVGFFFPQGYFQLNDEKGKFRSHRWEMEIDYRKVGETTWTDGRRIRELLKNVGPFRRQEFVAKGLDPDQYQVRFTNRSTTSVSDPSTDTCNLDFMTEGISFEENPFEVGNFAYLALNLEATGTINGTPLVTSIVKGRTVDVYTSAEESPVNQFSDNPAWCVLDFLTNARYGLGNLVSIDDIDIDSFVTVGEYCDQSDANGARHGRLDLVVDSVLPALDVLQLMLKSFGGFIQLVGGKIALGVDKDEVSSQLFDESNILAGTLQYDVASAQDSTSINRLNVRFRNKEKDYATDTFRLQVDEEISSERDVVERNIELFGVTRPVDVERQARRILNVLRTNIRSVEFQADMSTLQSRVGDVVSITHSLPGWDKKKFRIVSIEESPDQTRRITALEHNSSVYTTQDSVVTAVPNTNLFNPFLPPSGVTSVDLVPEFSVQLDGTIQNNLDVSWDYPSNQGASMGVDAFEVYYASTAPQIELASGTSFNSNDENSVFYTTSSGTVLSGTVGIPNTLGSRVAPGERLFEIQDLDDNVFVHVQVIPTTTARASRRRALEPVFSTFFPTYSGQPSNVDTFTSSISNGDALLTWSPIPTNEAPDLAGYEVRTNDGDFGVKDSNLVYRGFSTSAIDRDITDRSKVYYLRAYNNSGLYSVASVSESLSDSIPAAVTLENDGKSGPNIFLKWNAGQSNTTGYVVHASGVAGYTPSDASRVVGLNGRGTTTYTYQQKPTISGEYPPLYFKVAATDSLSEKLDDFIYSNEVAASGEPTVTVQNSSGELDPPAGVGLAFPGGGAGTIEESHLSVATVDGSTVNLEVNFSGYASDLEPDKFTFQARIRRGAGADPSSGTGWAIIREGPGVDAQPGQRLEYSYNFVDMPGSSVELAEGVYSYQMNFAVISGSESFFIETFNFTSTEVR